MPAGTDAYVVGQKDAWDDGLPGSDREYLYRSYLSLLSVLSLGFYPPKHYLEYLERTIE